MNRLSIFYEHIREAAQQENLPQEEVCRRAKAFGFDLVEIDAKLLFREGDTILPILEKNGVGINCIFNFFDFGIGEDHLEADRAEAQKVVDLCVRANSGKLLVVAGFLKPEEMERGSEKYLLRRDRMAKSVKVLVDLAAEHDITVVMEDFDGNSAPFSTAAELLWFMDNIPGLRCGFDTGNFLYSEEDAVAVLPDFLPHLVGVHCKDRSFTVNDGELKATVAGRNMYPVAVGDGDLDIEGMMCTVLDTGYTGVFTAEHFDSVHQLRDIERSAVFMRDVLERYYAK